MLPEIQDPIWRKLVKGEIDFKSTNVAINLLLFNSKLRYRKDPTDPNLNILVLHAYEVFRKQEPILGDELNQILPRRAAK